MYKKSQSQREKAPEKIGRTGYEPRSALERKVLFPCKKWEGFGIDVLLRG